ncbi:type II toxin-antitoxin system death-on-curing family toxin [Microbacterium sp.]|uniref:type II toxin-antitoxin system death-on-curing family toxin n=1 Tax=Microbacterium sp. TaxID=51671 RepID=UPI0039E68B8B
MTLYIEPPQAMAVVERMGLHVRDQGLLFSALARPSAGMFGQDAYPTLELKAAALFSSLAQNHPPFDGNKRLSLRLTFTFLRINGFRTTFTNDEAFDLVLRVAQSAIALEDLATELGAHLEPLDDAVAD